MEEGKTVIRIYCIRGESIFNKIERKKKKIFIFKIFSYVYKHIWVCVGICMCVQVLPEARTLDPPGAGFTGNS